MALCSYLIKDLVGETSVNVLSQIKGTSAISDLMWLAKGIKEKNVAETLYETDLSLYPNEIRVYFAQL